MVAQERRQEEERIIRKQKSMTVKELSELFDVTMETVRADLDVLCKKNTRLIKVHGGAFYKNTAENIIPIQLREKVMVSEKIRIAEGCTRFVKNGSIIMLDSSSTSDCIAKAIMDLGIPVVIITNNMSVLSFCSNAKNIKLIGTGGIYNNSLRSFNGDTTLKFLENYHSDVAFISPTAVSKEFGLSDDTPNEAEIRKLMIQNSTISVLAADNTKFDKSRLTKICDFSKIKYLVTDKKLNMEWTEFLDKQKIKVIVS